jgi:hypothetical protein
MRAMFVLFLGAGCPPSHDREYQDRISVDGRDPHPRQAVLGRAPLYHDEARARLLQGQVVADEQC